MSHSKGVSLIELVISMTTGSTLMVLAIGLVHQSMVLSQRSQHNADHDRTIAQLGRQFRDDIHHAAEFSVTIPESLQFRGLAGFDVVYRTEKNRVLRECLPTGDSENGRQSAFEWYLLDENCTATFRVLTGPDRAELVVVRESELGNNPPRTDLHVSAVVGRWRSLENSTFEKSAKESP